LKNIITGEDVDIAFESGEKKLFQSENFITSIAKEKREEYGTH
jgi:hypothetical protein